MKPRELIVWCLLLIAIALLFRTCNGDGNGGDTVPDKEVFVPGQTDTVVMTDTITLVVFRDRPVPVQVTPSPLATWPDSTIGMAPCDSIRTYNDSLINNHIGAFVTSTVWGQLVDQQIRLMSYGHDTTFHKTDTIKQTFVVPPSFNLSACGLVDLKNGPGIGVMVGLKRLMVGYQYFPITRSNQMVIGYSLFQR